MTERRRHRACQLGIMVRHSTWVVRRHRFSPTDISRRPEPLETSRP